MKRIASIFCLFGICSLAHAADSYTGKIYVTNAPSVGNTIIVNGDTRTWKTTVASVSDITLNPAGSNNENATNLWLNVIGNQFVGPLYVSMPSNNVVQLIGGAGQAMAISLSGSWGYFTITTNTASIAQTFRLPLTAESGAVATNNASMLVRGVNSFGTNNFNIVVGGTGVATLTTNALLFGNGTAPVGSLGLGTTITVLHGNASGLPTWGSVNQATDITGISPVVNGGSGVATLTTNSILFGNGTAPVGNLSLGSTTTLLHGNASGLPTWAAVNLASGGDVIGTLPVANGGSGVATLTTNALIFGNGTAAVGSLGLGTTTTLLHGNASGLPTYGAVTLTTDVTGVLPTANGGTGTAVTLTNWLFATTPTTSTNNLPSVGNKFIAFDGTNYIYFGSANIDGPTTNWIRMPYTHY